MHIGKVKSFQFAIFCLEETIGFIIALVLAAYCSKGEHVSFVVLFAIFIAALEYLYRLTRHGVRTLFCHYDGLVIEVFEQSIKDNYQRYQDKIKTEPLDAYVRDTLLKYKFEEEEIMLVLHYMHMLKHKCLRQAQPRTPIPFRDTVSQNDLKHLGWNIGEIYGTPGVDRAYFVRTAFHEWFKNTTQDTILRTLRDNRGGIRIQLFSPEDIKQIRGE